MHDLPDNLQFVNFFANDRSLFSTIHNILLSTKIMNKDPIKINTWANKWKISFKPDITKQAQKVILLWKSLKADHPKVYFNDASVAHTNCEKLLGKYLDEKLNFLQHIKGKTSKANRCIRVIQRLRRILLKKFFITTYISHMSNIILITVV